MKYYVFGFDARPNGGLHDVIATCDTLDEAKAAMEAEAPAHAYWGEYKGHIATIESNEFKTVLHYAAELEGNIYGGKIKEQVWSETGIETAALLSRIP